MFPCILHCHEVPSPCQQKPKKKRCPKAVMSAMLLPNLKSALRVVHVVRSAQIGTSMSKALTLSLRGPMQLRPCRAMHLLPPASPVVRDRKVQLISRDCSIFSTTSFSTNFASELLFHDYPQMPSPQQLPSLVTRPVQKQDLCANTDPALDSTEAVRSRGIHAANQNSLNGTNANAPQGPTQLAAGCKGESWRQQGVMRHAYTPVCHSQHVRRLNSCTHGWRGDHGPSQTCGPWSAHMAWWSFLAHQEPGQNA